MEPQKKDFSGPFHHVVRKTVWNLTKNLEKGVQHDAELREEFHRLVTEAGQPGSAAGSTRGKVDEDVPENRSLKRQRMKKIDFSLNITAPSTRD